ncbi:MAG: hypothetical protein HY788_17930 [Deltaproteobacteria bacterium]|nr:hypothetical protein [Deltaproteobacteria bacterium]
MGKRSVLVLAVCWLWIAVLFTSAVRSEDCAFFFEDFSGLSVHSWSYFDATWVEQSQTLAVSQIETDRIAVARTAFHAADLYQIDVDLEVLAGGSDAGFGIYTYTSGDAFLDVGGRTADGIAAMVYPGEGQAALMAWDVTQGEWFDSNSVSASQPITSIGFSLSDNQAVLRLNRQDTAAVFSGSFTFAPWVVDTIWLMAEGTGAQARFDNVCADTPGSGPSPTTGDYDGIWKNAGQTMNFYIQTYAAGSALVIATADLKTLYVFLSPSFSNGMDINDMAGGGHHLTLNFSSSEQASAVLTPSGSAPRTYAISKFFSTPPVTTHDGIWKSPDCQAGVMNYYVQSYDTGAGIVIATSDLSALHVFLDPNFSDGVDVADLAGTGAHLTLSLAGGQTTPMVRCFIAPHDASGGSPTASCNLTGLGPSPNPKVVLGPGGSSIGLADEVIPNKTVTLSSADASEVVESGETSVSGAVRVSVGGGEEPLSGNGFFKISLPVTGDVAEPAHLTMKTKLTTGLVLPVYGEYDSTAKTYSAEVAALYNGWVFGVVTQPNQVLYLDTGSLSPAAWQTEFDWKTFSWHVVDPSNTLTEVNVREIQSAAKSASQALSNALFRAPKLWVSTGTNPHARLIHHVAGNLQFKQPGTEEDANYSLVSKTEQEMLALGQLYLDYDAIKTSLAAKGITLGHVVVHELLHAVQAGYDIRVGWDNTTHSLKPYYEGTAGPFAQSYQDNNGSISGPAAVVRNIVGGGDEFAILNRAVDDYTKRNENKDYYSKQDFFVYVTRMYNHNDWSYLGSLFQDLYTATLNKFGLSMAEYRKLYRTALNTWVAFWTSKSLSEAYFNYVVDRAYKHPAEALFRDTENFVPNKLATSLFTANVGFKTLNQETERVEFEAVEPLSAYAVQVVVPDGYRTETESKLPRSLSLQGGDLGAEAVRIVVFRENDQGVMLSSEGEIYLTDISKPVEVTVSRDAPTLTVLIMNGYMEDKTVKASVSIAGQVSTVEYEIGFTRSGEAPCLVIDKSGEPYSSAWNGSEFSGSKPATALRGEHRIEGQVAGGGGSLITVTLRALDSLDPSQEDLRVSLADVPMTSSTATTWVYELQGAALLAHITDAMAVCGVDIVFTEVSLTHLLGESRIRIELAKP